MIKESFEEKYKVEIQAYNKADDYITTKSFDDRGKEAMFHMIAYNFWFCYFRTRNDLPCYIESVRKALEPIYSDEYLSKFEEDFENLLCLTIKNSYDKFPDNVDPKTVGSTAFNYSYVKDYFSRIDNSV